MKTSYNTRRVVMVCTWVRVGAAPQTSVPTMGTGHCSSEGRGTCLAGPSLRADTDAVHGASEHAAVADTRTVRVQGAQTRAQVTRLGVQRLRVNAAGFVS